MPSPRSSSPGAPSATLPCCGSRRRRARNGRRSPRLNGSSNTPDRLAWNKFETPIAYHDSCHVTKKVGKPQPARDLLSLMADVVEIADTPEKCVCCGYYNIHVNPEVNHQLHADKLALVRKRGAGGLAVECVTCWESFAEPFKEAGVPLWELMVAAEQATRPEDERA